MLINSSHKQAGTLVKERQHTIDLAKVKTNIIGATWLIGKSGACYAADPGLKLGEDKMAIARRLRIWTVFRFVLFSTKYWLVQICRVANNAATISHMTRMRTPC